VILEGLAIDLGVLPVIENDVSEAVAGLEVLEDGAEHANGELCWSMGTRLIDRSSTLTHVLHFVERASNQRLWSPSLPWTRTRKTECY